MGPDDQPVPLHVAVVTSYTGPAYYTSDVRYLHVAEGGRVLFVNPSDYESYSYEGAGFSSGLVPPLQAREVQGISSLKVGTYTVYNQGEAAGYLIIDPDPLDSISQGSIIHTCRVC